MLKRAFKIICRNISYSQALSLANETTLSNGRELLCHKFMAEMTDKLLITLDLVLLDHSASSRHLRDQRTFLLLNIRRWDIRHEYLFK